jgi:hypothetical protein
MNYYRNSFITEADAYAQRDHMLSLYTGEFRVDYDERYDCWEVSGRYLNDKEQRRFNRRAKLDRLVAWIGNVPLPPRQPFDDTPPSESFSDVGLAALKYLAVIAGIIVFCAAFPLIYGIVAVVFSGLAGLSGTVVLLCIVVLLLAQIVTVLTQIRDRGGRW